MKHALALVLCLCLLISTVAPAMAIDRTRVHTQDLWAVDGDGISNGDHMFSDWYMQALYFFGKHFRWHW